jgi:hypothetical protein
MGSQYSRGENPAESLRLMRREEIVITRNRLYQGFHSPDKPLFKVDRMKIQPRKSFFQIEVPPCRHIPLPRVSALVRNIVQLKDNCGSSLAQGAGLFIDKQRKIFILEEHPQLIKMLALDVTAGQKGGGGGAEGR